MSEGKFGRLRSAVVQWRNWSLPVKLGAVVLVPVIFAITLGIGQIRWQVDRAAEFGRVEEVLDAVERIEPLVDGLQRERNSAVEFLVGDGDAGAVDREVAAVDRAMGEVGEVIESTDAFGPVVVDRYRELRPRFDELAALRQQVHDHQLRADQAIGAYSDVINSVMSLNRALTGSVADRSLSSTAFAMQDMLALIEEVRLQQAWVLTGLSEGSLQPQALDSLQGSRARLLGKIVDARATVAAHWQQRLDETLLTRPIVERNQMLAALLKESTDGIYSGGYSVTQEDWNQGSDASVQTINEGRDELAAEVRAIASQLENEASDAAGWDSVLLLSALIIAAAIIIVIARQLLRSLRELRTSALDAADYELPAAVDAIRQGNRADAAVSPVPIDTTDEVGQVARAFDEVNEQALRLAVEQADLRRGYNDMFVSVSRRSQSLLERQLRLFEELEQDEEDPDQLARLFQLDHLATRMRRNNENLMVLSGHDLARRFTQPTDLADVLRAAVSEIEQYPRVMVQPPPAAKLRGHTASDLVRLVAELLDNAANFSAPDTTVTVSSYQAGDGTVVLDVLDQGIGMGDAELERANERLAAVDEDDLATSRRMGLFVAGRLAVRHGVGVELHGGPDVEGVRATVMIPAEHVVTVEPGPVLPAAPQLSGRNGHTHTDLPTSGELPRRKPAENSPWQEPGPSSLFESHTPEPEESPTAHLFDAPLDIPQQPRAVPGEFDWPGVEPPAERPEEESPIFEEASTQWFQPASEKAQSETGEFSWPGAQDAADDFPSAAAPQPEPPSLTDSGLPRRTPRGAAEPDAKPSRSAEDISRRLAQNGVQFGGSTDSRLSPVEPEPWIPHDPGADDAWNFAADKAREAAEAAANPQPGSFTQAGLPRRTPKAHLVPGSVANSEPTSTGTFQRDADRLRGRLADFQSGVSRGRHRATDED
ncbi:Signal transduction histidine kinase [Saccharopolyspora antimicrobica]|uniref:histidine kinase n=1 Tax=Saccharopolyspora antimicrobica TaxID=455193 RepID=A0A1I5F3D5_9PSEU|nr:sensor histidine kinase [Saccharopolyspora antimicrobica]RKT83659.1 signal transduction histidine kinase [Saccharopolyspora antimicrobica]SFO18126.1 Signal transduction histidine kinase [Saccharopolyspora antimicrobica]